MTLDPRTVGFLAVGGLAVAGTMAGQLGATSATTFAAGTAAGTATAIFLTLMLLTAAAASAASNRLAARWGTLKTFGWAQGGVAASWTIAGVIEAVTDSSLLVLFLAAPVFGVFSGVTAVLTPFACRSYVNAGSMTDAVAKRSAVSGVAAILGSVIGGYVIHVTAPGIGIVANGLLTIPLAIFILFVRPGGAVTAPRVTIHAARAVVAALRSDRNLRRLAVLVAAFMLFVVPMVGMLVPILDDLDHSPLPSGAGLMLGGIAAGRLLVPGIVRWLRPRYREFTAAVRAAVATAAFMILFAISAVPSFTDADLVIWTVIGIGIGASRFTTRAIMTGAASSSMGPGMDMLGVTALVLIGAVASPVGYLVWGPMIDLVSAPVTITAAAAAMIAVGVILGRAGRQA
ncbi:MAG: MFS transporter [Miltoncostaeaceae bacterium]